LAALLALGAVGGAIAAIVLADNGSGKSSAAPKPRTVVSVRTVTRQGSTVRETVTTSTAAAGTASSSESGSALNDAGYRKMQAGDYQGALPVLQSAVQKLTGVGYPLEAYANYNLGYTLLKLGRCDEAIPYLKTARKLEPQRSEPRQALALAKACR
jgi:Flp pilus assembly protein TadD